MMPELGKYTVSVLGAYGAAAVLLAVLVGMTVWRSRRITRRLADAEKETRRG